jgi:hypothetical protein
MNKPAHRLYIFSFVLITFLVLIYLTYSGFSYYNTILEERFFHSDHELLKPSGPIGHGLGIIGSLVILFGVFSYMVRKRNRSLMRLGLLKHWLEFHIFMCTLGPVMILFHTAFKFGGLVAVSFWSMVAVFLSGIIGRFIYLQIPRSIEGRELSLSEIKDLKSDVGSILIKSLKLDDASLQTIIDSTKNKIGIYHENFLVRSFRKFKEDRNNIQSVRSVLKSNKIPRDQSRQIIKLVKNEIKINRRIDRLNTMQNLFKYWHVAHLPFALVMLVIMVVHVIITVAFGFKWIF